MQVSKITTTAIHTYTCDACGKEMEEAVSIKGSKGNLSIEVVTSKGDYCFDCIIDCILEAATAPTLTPLVTVEEKSDYTPIGTLMREAATDYSKSTLEHLPDLPETILKEEKTTKYPWRYCAVGQSFNIIGDDSIVSIKGKLDRMLYNVQYQKTNYGRTYQLRKIKRGIRITRIS